jgi:hypothetical protein
VLAVRLIRHAERGMAIVKEEKMRKTLTLPIKTALRGTLAQYAKQLPAPHKSIIQQPVIEARSRLFDPEIVQVPKRRKMKKCHTVESTGLPMPPKARGTMNRPDKSEQRTNLTFNWSPA